MKRFISIKAVRAVGILTLLFVAGGYTPAGSQPPCDPNANGTVLRSFNPSPGAPLGSGRAVAYDGGTTLYYTVRTPTDHNIYMSTTNGVFLGAIPLAGRNFLCGALSWDPVGQQLWGGAYDGSGVYTIDPMTGAATFQFPHPFQPGESCFPQPPQPVGAIDGLAFDSYDNTLWLSDDAATKIYHVTLTGTNLPGSPFNTPLNPVTGQPGCNSGIEVTAGGCLYLSLITSNMIVKVAKNSPSGPIIDWFFNGNFGAEDLEFDANTFAPCLVLWSNTPTSPNLLEAWQVECEGNCAEEFPDAWIQDKDPCDDGTQPDPCPYWDIWMGDGIRVRNSISPTHNPWHDQLSHQNPIAGQTNYVYVRVRNRGNTPVSGVLWLYWSAFSSYQKWVLPDGPPTLGDFIDNKPVTVGPCPPYPEESIVEFEWPTPERPKNFCLLARFVSTQENPMYETDKIYDNARDYNNIALKNLFVILPPGSPGVSIQNVAQPANVDLEFNSAGGGSGIPFLDGGSVRVVLSPEMFSHWMGAGGIGQGIIVNPDSSISLMSLLAKIQGIPMGVDETQPVTMYFAPDSGRSIPTFQRFVLSQFSDGQTIPDGGVTFEFRSGTGEDIPTLTEWGLIIFGVMLLGFITWVFLRRRKAAVSLR